MEHHEIIDYLYQSYNSMGSNYVCRSYGNKIFVWLSENTSLPLWVIYCLISTLILFISVKITHKLFGPRKCTRKNHIWTSGIVIAISSWGLFGPDIANFVHNVTKDIPTFWYDQIIPGSIKSFFNYMLYNAKDHFFENWLNYTTYYFTILIGLSSLIQIFFEDKMNKHSYFTRVGISIFILTIALVCIFILVFVIQVFYYVIFGLLTLLVKFAIPYFYIFCAYSFLWIIFAFPGMVFKMGLVFKLVIIAFGLYLFVKGVIALD